MKINKFKSFIFNFFLAILASVLFALSHPNYIVLRGIPLLAYFAFIPLFILVKRIKFRFSFAWGAFVGALSYFIFNFWLIYFHSLSIFVVILQYFVLYLFLFPILKIIDIRYPKWSFLFNSLIWVAFEYIKTLGFLGYPYGIIGYSQWSFPTLIRVSAIFGVWGISFLIVLCSSIITEIILKKQERKFYTKALCAWCGIFLAFLFYGLITKTDYSNEKNIKIALIQPNKDPWLGNIEVYRNNFQTLKELSEKALEKESAIDLIVWPETAFIPRIKWHYKYSLDAESTILVRELLSFIDSQNTPFLIGNDDAIYDESIALNNSLYTQSMPDSKKFELGRVDYNAALLFSPKMNVLPPNPEIYRKRRLVPFTEHFPYAKIFPRINQLLIENDTHFWNAGTECKIFDLKNIKFSTPICFEDCFGYISRDFVKNGAELIINITNDAWANSSVSQYQHFTMSVFRAVENRVPVLRSAVSGQTVYINQNGEVVSMLPEFTENFLIANLNLKQGARKTTYSILGDFFAILCLFMSIVLLLLTFIRKEKK